MQPTSQELKAGLMHSRLLTLRLQQAVAACRSGSLTECKHFLREASGISRSIHAIFQTGSGSDFTTLDTTQEPPIYSGKEQAENGPLGTSVLDNSDSFDDVTKWAKGNRK